MTKEALNQEIQKILDKLKVLFDEQGLRVELDYIDQKTSTAYFRMERFAKGLPAAFIIKGMGGTFRRYLPEIKEAAISSYQGLAEPERNEAPAEASHDSEAHNSQKTPGLSLKGCGRAEAARALCAFLDMMRRNGENLFRITGTDEKEVAPALRQWLAINALKSKDCGSGVMLASTGDIPETIPEPGATIPARIIAEGTKTPENQE